MILTHLERLLVSLLLLMVLTNWISNPFVMHLESDLKGALFIAVWRNHQAIEDGCKELACIWMSKLKTLKNRELYSRQDYFSILCISPKEFQSQRSNFSYQVDYITAFTWPRASEHWFFLFKTSSNKDQFGEEFFVQPRLVKSALKSKQVVRRLGHQSSKSWHTLTTCLL